MVVVQQRRPLRPRVRGPQQHRADVIVAVDGRGDEVIPRGAVDVDDDGAAAEGLADQAGDPVERGVELARRPDTARRGKRVAQTGERRMGRSRHLRYSSASQRRA